MRKTKFRHAMDDLAREVVQIYMEETPVDTGWQRDHIYADRTEFGGFEIIIDTDYVQYTTDPWPAKRGKNPNEGWEERAANRAEKLIQSRLKGSL